MRRLASIVKTMSFAGMLFIHIMNVSFGNKQLLYFPKDPYSSGSSGDPQNYFHMVSPQKTEKSTR